MPADIDWPTYLPLPATLAGSKTHRVIRTEMEDQFVRQTRQAEDGSKTYTLSWDFDQQQKFLFDCFFDGTLQGGTLYFNLPMASGMDQTLSSRVVRFIRGTKDENYIPFMNWTVQVSAEEQPGQDDPDLQAIIVYIYGISDGDLDAYYSYMLEYDEFVNSDTWW